ncbi:polysaccharide pyruvyl transferase family protein [Dongia deserti]|uniref:polysaccharide pyruvyl transferase family protein n=1 Tax=Dongia deserti TaxID=2268030 RepID=UPI000E659658|nr:polysaccharide pyruvyl transferase family protein [Dongia deserti]
MVRIRLTGDHSSYHCGSAAVTQVIAAELRRHGEIVTGDDFDVLVVNGEGSMHHGGGAFRDKMRLIEMATASARPAFLVNSVWQDNPHEFDAALAKCRQIVVREVLSQRAIAQHDVTADVVPDLSYFAPITRGDAVDLKGGIVMTDFLSHEFGSFVRLRSRWAERFSFLDMRAMDWSSLVGSLKTARLLLTGRHHAVYAACKARTPFLALAGNTHKIEGIIASAGADIPVFRTFSELKASIQEAENWRSRYDRLFDWLERQEPWRLPA